MYSSVQNGNNWQSVQSGGRFGQQTSFSQNNQNNNMMNSGNLYSQNGLSSSGGMMAQSGLMSSSGAVYSTAQTQYNPNQTQYTAAQGYSSMSGGYNLREGERVESTRKISSVVVGEEYLGALPNYDEVRYVEVPYIEEVVKHVPRREVVEVEKRVPKYEYEYIEKIVEIPQIQIVDKHVEVPQIQEVIRHVPRVQVVDVPREVLRHVPKIETKMIEKIVEVPGQLVEVPKPYTVENPVHVTRYVDKECPLVVAQSMKPSIVEGQEQIDVEVFEYEPECVPVDVHVLKGVNAHIIAAGSDTMHKLVSVPAAQYNTMLKSLNSHLGEVEVQKLPYLTEAGRVPFVTDGTKFGIAPAQGAVIYDMMGQTRREFNVSVNGQVIANSMTYTPGSAQQLLPSQANTYPNSQMNMMSQLQTGAAVMDQNFYNSHMGGSQMMMASNNGPRSTFGATSGLNASSAVSLSAVPATARTTFSKEGSAHFVQSNSLSQMSPPMGSIAMTTVLDSQPGPRSMPFGASAYAGNSSAMMSGPYNSSMGASYPSLQVQGSQSNLMGQSAYRGTNMGMSGYQGQFAQSNYVSERPTSSYVA